MKQCVLFSLLVLSLAACDNSAKVESKADSLKQELDTSLGKIKDSVKAKGERTLDAVKAKIDDLRSVKDSVRDTLK
ncbi:hypothetical protein [Flavisolibacter nicotianae]|uniref:hypothetical protein n=1 Tax=Flavisolibacter nicotianae TaxID=2364882 RepID=UPI000EAD799E|nr:hypothetical protein [Flavisolibacter nicotianae]